MESKKSANLSEIAYNYILNKVISFEYKPGDLIVENNICEELSVSRTPVREALRRLEAENFVNKVCNRGTFVRSYTQDDIIECCDIRCIFETYCLEKCITLVPTESIKAIKGQLLNLTENSPPEDFFRCDENFHGLIIQYGMNRRIEQILSSIDVQISAVRKLSAKKANRLRRSRQEHLQIVEMMGERNLEESERLLKAHLEAVKENCVDEFQKMRMYKLTIGSD